MRKSWPKLLLTAPSSAARRSRRCRRRARARSKTRGRASRWRLPSHASSASLSTGPASEGEPDRARSARSACRANARERLDGARAAGARHAVQVDREVRRETPAAQLAQAAAGSKPVAQPSTAPAGARHRVRSYPSLLLSRVRVRASTRCRAASFANDFGSDPAVAVPAVEADPTARGPRSGTRRCAARDA